MNSKYRIKDKKEFDELIKNAKKKKNLFFTLCFQEKKYKYGRFGLAISKKYYNAVERNYFKRILREIIRKDVNFFQYPFDCIIIINKECKNYKYFALREKFLDIVGEI